ncbi:MAG: sugar kinase [Castellaniella sp.]|uniref:Sugar kinase n=1 Tax=Castellaniella hirudinis TaxID=1144617 RepID=A0ABV8RZB1_9BURK
MTTNESLDVVTLGEAMVMLVAGQPGPLEQVDAFDKRTAGAETNVAIGLARLGLRVGWGSRLGQDSLGRYLLDSLRGEGVDCSRVALVAGERTGLLFKDRVLDGSDPKVEYHRAGSAASRMRPDDVDQGWLLSARHLHSTGVFAAVSDGSFQVTKQTMRLMREAGRTVSFDTNLRPTLWASTEAMRAGINELAALADWVLPGVEEGLLLTGERAPEAIARFYLDLGARLVVVKLGADGAYYDDGTRSGHVPASPVAQVVDTVGAGDGFAVGVISGLLEGLPLERAVARGAWIGARMVQVPGDTEGLPTRAELQAAGL